MRHTLVLLLTACALVLGGAPAGAAGTTATKVRGLTSKAQSVKPGATVKYTVKVTAQGKASKSRVATLQRRVNGRWVRADRKRTNRYGRVVLRHRVSTKAGAAVKLRVRVSAKGRYRAVNSPVKTVRTRTAWTPDARSKRVLALVNDARSTARECGAESFPARGPLRLNARLTKSAQAHGADMAAHGYFSHTGRNGSTLRDRVEAQGYSWSTIGENIAAGDPSAEAVVARWIKSAGHCRNIMAAGFTELGVGYVTSKDKYGTYWVQNFGTPR
ncbi:CAP domain-containing protein [Aeromicrobium duanguangcaii]|uniref:CAP domain-containing protein n=1 Tax=Aeromicrobium duanguangcaii TaxID=2968086 RepID=UPI00201836A0|nr:CAP domain-containing protein [Aeromicrobium duanguangcaii]MCL3836451.1 CAP domain-containing protein [Aeromicrobium duanguangcaii]